MSSARQIVSNHALVKCYNAATGDANSQTADVFWQMVFATHFPMPSFLFTPAWPKSLPRRRRVLTFYPDVLDQPEIEVLWLEVMDASESGTNDDGHLVAAEAEAAHAVYAMAVIGTTFRLWRIGDGAARLELVGGARTDDSEYLDAKSDEGCRLFFALRQEVYAAHKPSG
jgi:hypothetical protein